MFRFILAGLRFVATNTKSFFRAAARRLSALMVAGSTVYDNASTSRESQENLEVDEAGNRDGDHFDLYPEKSLGEHEVRNGKIEFSKTEQKFSVREIYFGDNPPDVSIELTSLPKIAHYQQRQLQVFSNVSDLKHLSPDIRDHIDWLKSRGDERVPLGRLTGADFASKRILTSVQSLLTGAAVQPLPADGVLFVSMSFAATPELPDWINAGGKPPDQLAPPALQTVKNVISNAGAKLLFMDGWFELKDRGVPGSNNVTHLFERDFAKANWPSALLSRFDTTQVFLQHFHIVMAAFDDNGFIGSQRIEAALKAAFPGRKAVHVQGMIDKRQHALEAARCREYAWKKLSTVTRSETIEDARWRLALTPSDVVFGGWEGTANTWELKRRRMASLIAREKIIEALEGFEIAQGSTGA
jgi:hypothetical protein